MTQNSQMPVRQAVLLGGNSVTVDWLSLFSTLPSDYWREWHPLLFLPLDLENEWLRWDHYLRESFKEAGTLLNMQAYGEHVLLIPHEEREFARLLQLPGQWSDGRVASQGLILFSDGNEPQDQFWAKCILSSTAQLESDLVKLPWKAAIGPYPHQNAGGSSTHLSLCHAVEIGGMLIEPLGECIVDRSFSRQYPSLSSLLYLESWPLTVSGTALGYGEDAVKDHVTRDLVLLSSVFSLISGIPWIVRELPFVYGDNEIHWSEEFFGSGGPHTQEGSIDFQVPSWTEDAFQLAKSNDDYGKALLMFSEALQLEGTHPSITLISYMACLQSLGRIIERNKNRQLETMLRKVVGDDEVKEILRYYGHRSETAHHAVLWAGEEVAHSNRAHPNPFIRDAVPFLMILWKVKDALVSAFEWILDYSTSTKDDLQLVHPNTG